MLTAHKQAVLRTLLDAATQAKPLQVLFSYYHPGVQSDADWRPHVDGGLLKIQLGVLAKPTYEVDHVLLTVWDQCASFCLALPYAAIISMQVGVTGAHFSARVYEAPEAQPETDGNVVKGPW